MHLIGFWLLKLWVDSVRAQCKTCPDDCHFPVCKAMSFPDIEKAKSEGDPSGIQKAGDAVTRVVKKC